MRARATRWILTSARAGIRTNRCRSKGNTTSGARPCLFEFFGDQQKKQKCWCVHSDESNTPLNTVLFCMIHDAGGSFSGPQRLIFSSPKTLRECFLCFFSRRPHGTSHRTRLAPLLFQGVDTLETLPQNPTSAIHVLPRTKDNSYRAGLLSWANRQLKTTHSTSKSSSNQQKSNSKHRPTMAMHLKRPSNLVGQVSPFSTSCDTHHVPNKLSKLRKVQVPFQGAPFWFHDTARILFRQIWGAPPRLPPLASGSSA